MTRSGAHTPLAEFGPRFGFAYDVTGKGSTVVRGGFGTYYNHDRDNPYYDAMSNPPLVQAYTAPGPTTLPALFAIQPGAVISDVLVIDPANSNVPYTYEYNLTISQRLPWQSSMQISYIGNSSHNQQVSGFNQNYVPFGAETAAVQAGLSPNDNAYRRYGNFGAINYITNFLTANYNALQITAQRQVGRINFTAAYTFSKALGTGVGDNTGGTSVAPTDPRHLSYGPLIYDRTHQVQLSYIFQLPGLNSGANRFARGVVNGWNISGITILQSGGPLTPNNGLGMAGVNQRLVTGSPDYNAYPQLVPGCNPTSNLGSHQLFNAACFTAPTAGQNGPAELPYYIRGPWFWNSDLSLHKSFNITERQRLEFRIESFNFLNHPLWTQYNSTLFNGSTSGYATGPVGNRVVQLLAKYYF